MAAFDTAWVENGNLLNFLHCLWNIGKGSNLSRRKEAVTDHLKRNVKAKRAHPSLLLLCRTRLMGDVASPCDMKLVCSRDAHEKLASAFLNVVVVVI